MRTLPGVRDVGVVSILFTQPPQFYQGFVQEGDGLELAETPKRALTPAVLPNLDSALGLRLVEGRFLRDTDTAERPFVTVVSASLAAKYWPGQSPVGKRVRVEGARSNDWAEIVGVVSNVLGLGNQPRPVDSFYFTIPQANPPGLGMGFMVRHRAVAPNPRALQRAMWQVDPHMQFFAHISPAELYARGSWQTRFVAQLITAFALLAVALALAGIYAVNSFLVARRVNEFGIRAALGATRANILRLVLRDSLRLTLAGLGAGALLAFATSRGIANLLYNVPPLDALVYAGAALLMTAACVAATVMPARRAAKVDPVTALRAE